MGSNPFAITSDELLKRQQGIQGTGDSGKTENTKETREAKETEKIKSTDIYSLAGQNGGSMATTNGVFENYDGFTRTTTQTAAKPESEDEKDGKSLLNKTFGATGEARTQKANCNEYQDVAKRDTNFVNQQVKKQEQGLNKTQSEVESALTQSSELGSENSGLQSEVDSLNSEIETLMAEDGQSYTPQEAAPAAAQPQAASSGDSTADPTGGAGMTGSTSGSTGGAASGNTAGGVIASSGNTQTFAMNSLPSSGGADYAPTSITATSAQNNAAAEQTGETDKKKQGEEQNANANKAGTKSTAGGNSLQSFGNSLVKGKGKNADKINELLDQVNSKNSKITSNSSTMSSLTNSATQKTDSFQAQLKAIMNQTVSKKTANTDNNKGAKTAQIIGTATTTTGGLATATGASMLALSWGTNTLGVALMAGGGVATAAGTGTSSIASLTQGDTQGAMTTATNGLNTFTGQMGQVRQAKQDIKAEQQQQQTA